MAQVRNPLRICSLDEGGAPVRVSLTAVSLDWVIKVPRQRIEKKQTPNGVSSLAAAEVSFASSFYSQFFCSCLFSSSLFAVTDQIGR
jgi:hypothetical protein